MSQYDPTPRHREKHRIQALDVIRGVSILAILAVNADGYAAPMIASLRPGAWPFPNEGATAIAYWIMDAFFHEKFVTMFSMLFGISLFLVGGETSDKQRGAVLRRRLIVLFFLGLLHGFGIWWGDILSLYAAAGLILFFFRSLSARRLMQLGLTLYLALALTHVPALLEAGPEPSTNATTSTAPHAAAAHAETAARVSRTIEEASGSWAGAYRVNARQYLRILQGDLYLLPHTLALMMIGLSLFKSGFMAGRSATRTYGLTMSAGLIGLGLAAWASWQRNLMGLEHDAVDFAIDLITPVITLGYAAALMLALRTGVASRLSPLSAVGRMAFTNYLTQSLIMTSLFYGGRVALMGQVDRPALWAIVVAIWILQLAWSSWWMSRFAYGPFEWVWRCLTYGRLMPIRARAGNPQGQS